MKVLRLGDRVVHVRFGPGIVDSVGDVDSRAVNPEYVCDVRFDDGELRNVMAHHLRTPESTSNAEGGSALVAGAPPEAAASAV